MKIVRSEGSQKLIYQRIQGEDQLDVSLDSDTTVRVLTFCQDICGTTQEVVLEIDEIKTVLSIAEKH